jgi:hypothetical protein
METQAPTPPNIDLYLLTYPLNDLLWGRSALKLVEPAARALQHILHQGGLEGRNAEACEGLVRTLLPRSAVRVKFTNRDACAWLLKTYNTPKDEAYEDWISLYLKESERRVADGTTQYDAMVLVLLDLLDHVEALSQLPPVAKVRNTDG